ncbi:Interferon-induced gtp-binding protein mx, partial [Globisporangium splendens]
MDAKVRGPMGNSKHSSRAKSELLARVQDHDKRQLVDHLREIGLDQYVELPQIAVMGDTSSGKSSLLSALSGVSFPSSDQLTTRCPTQLILNQGDVFRGSARLVRYRGARSRHGGSDDQDREDREELLHIDDVPIAIERFTKKLIAEGQYISDDQIVIELCGPDLPNLTLTDLPGLVRTVGDSEDSGIIGRVRQLVGRYMTQERTIIIAVVPANVDMHNTEILQAAQEADPKGVRTIAVVTKLDLVDAGAEKAVHELLMNKKKFMHLGYHAVKCRSQRDVSSGVSIEVGLMNEKRFFIDHEYWHRLPEHIWGISNLSNRLVSILQDNIRRSLPKVIQEINERIEDAIKGLQELGETLETAGARRQQFGRWMNAYLRYMDAAVSGHYDVLPKIHAQQPKSEGRIAKGLAFVEASGFVDLRLRAVLRHSDSKFRDAIKATKSSAWRNGKAQQDVCVGDIIETHINGGWEAAKVIERNGGDIRCSEFPDEWIGLSRWRYPKYHSLKKFIRENRGDELSIFPSFRVFCNLFRGCVDEWSSPTKCLIESYHTQITNVSNHMIKELHAVPRVETFLVDTMNRILTKLVHKAESEMQNLLRVEYRPYTQDDNLHREFNRRRLEVLKAQFVELVPSLYSKISEVDVLNAFTQMMTLNEDREAQDMETALDAYFDVSSKRVVDNAPIRLNDLMTVDFLKEMENELMGITDEKLAWLLEESDQKRIMRSRLMEEMACLKRAKEKIMVMRDGGTVDLRLRAGTRREELGFQNSIAATKSKATPDTREQSEVQVGGTVEVCKYRPWYTAQVAGHGDEQIRCDEFDDCWFSPSRWKFLQEMEEELLSTTDAKLAKLMHDSASKVAERKQLVHELDCLKNAKEEIELVIGQ